MILCLTLIYINSANKLKSRNEAAFLIKLILKIAKTYKRRLLRIHLAKKSKKIKHGI